MVAVAGRMTMGAIGLAEIDGLTGGRLGTFDVPCPLCGPFKRTPRNQRREVLRIYRIEPRFAGFHCARCGEKGHARDRDAAPSDPAKLAKARADAAQRDRIHKAGRLSKARWLLSCALPIHRTIAETYLREARGYGGRLWGTLGFLPARGAYPPALIAAFGLPIESASGDLVITDSAVRGAHLTRLLPDGSGKAEIEGANAKIMIGHSTGWPIVLAPMGDLLGLAIAEGIENALSVHEATGLGAWAAGCASRLPALAAVIDPRVECVTVVADDDYDGRRHAIALAEQVRARGIEARPMILQETR